MKIKFSVEHPAYPRATPICGEVARPVGGA